MGADEKPTSNFKYSQQPTYTTSNGAPTQHPEAYQRAGGPNGPLLLQDFHLIDMLAHFDRERIPERVVHAKGAGAYGTFEVTHDISDITTIDILDTVGKETKAVARFSTVGGEKGSPDSAVILADSPSNSIQTRRNPETHLKDATMFWDYLSTHQEAIHQVMHLFSDRGTPYSYRHMNGYSGHTHKWHKADGSFNYVQVHIKIDQGNKTFNNEEASKMASSNPDWQTQDLFEAIQKGDYPTWTVYVQVLSPEQADKFRWNIFDLTKVWPQADVPLRPFGKFTLNKNAENYFAEIEQVAFSPSHLVPGIESSADPVLQSRLFSYPDAHRHRLGVNYQQIPVNTQLHAFNPFQRDGAMAVNGNYGSNPNYPSSYRPLSFKQTSPVTHDPHQKWVAQAVMHLNEVVPDDYIQAKGLWEVLRRTAGQQESFVKNVAGHLCAAKKDLRDRTYEMFTKMDVELGSRISTETEKLVPQPKGSAQSRL
ncbi:hypothetical protein VE02_10078 [Pseudogymnoascus sp. 03VT05]|nr:hypothetical protein VE02_10078 [Pseudogymnoascus sp. 03VT05]